MSKASVFLEANKGKLSFKRHQKLTGLAATGYPHQSVDIKLDGKICGIIAAPSWQTKDNDWHVKFMVKSEGTSPFKWIRVKESFKDEESARNWVTSNWDRVKSSVQLYAIELYSLQGAVKLDA